MESVEKNMAKILVEKAHELFKICDQEEKGFICKRDMQRMLKEMPMDPGELEDVFDSLDVDGNGFLTLEEFTTGFGQFLGLPDLDAEEQAGHTGNSSDVDEGRRLEPISEQDQDEDDEFLEFLVSSGASDIVGDNDEGVRQLWRSLRAGPLASLQALASVLRESSEKLQSARSEQLSLESAMKQQYDALNEQIQNMSEEMESQIAVEKERKLKELDNQEQKVREDMESQLALKDLELHMTNKRFSETEAELKRLTAADNHQKSEMEELQKQRDKLEDQLNNQRILIEDLKNSIHQTRTSAMDERKKRAMAAFSVTETIAQEREDLVKQLGVLKSVNARLMDDRDTTSQPQPMPHSQHQLPFGLEALLPSSAPNSATSMSRLDVPDSGLTLEESDCEVDDSYAQVMHDRGGIHTSTARPSTPQCPVIKGALPLRPAISLLDELCENDSLSMQHQQDSSMNQGSMNKSDGSTEDASTNHSSTLLIYQGRSAVPTSRSQPGPSLQQHGPTSVSMMSSSSCVSLSSQPQRVYKVIIIGDAGVGKTCFVQRICTGEVEFTYATTIGVDFRVHTITVDEKVVSIQLWDTAGQERYRSITKQYFRKADGVFVTFDVTSENSFKNCRQWIDSVKELAAEDVCVILLGNKVDLCPDAERRVITPHQADQLASSYQSVYMECSATTDVGVDEAIETMARSLVQREDQGMENAIQLVAKTPGKRACCA